MGCDNSFREIQSSYYLNSLGRLFTRGQPKLRFLRNQWASGFLYKRVNLMK